MPSSPAAGTRVEPSVEDQFLDLVCADEELLRAEFDAIIAAEWPNPAGGAAAGTARGSRHARRGYDGHGHPDRARAASDHDTQASADWSGSAHPRHDNPDQPPKGR
jgi:hypothetical protein